MSCSRSVFIPVKKMCVGNFSLLRRGSHRSSRNGGVQQQSSSSASNRFIEHDISTRKLGPSLGIRPSFLNRPIYTFMSGCCYALPEIVLKKNAKLFLEICSCLCGFAVKLC